MKVQITHRIVFTGYDGVRRLLGYADQNVNASFICDLAGDPDRAGGDVEWEELPEPVEFDDGLGFVPSPAVP